MVGGRNSLRIECSKKIISGSPWEPHLSGFFSLQKSSPLFMYMDRDQVCAFDCQNGSGQIVYSEHGLPIPQNWVLVYDGKYNHLFLKDGLAIDINAQQVVTHIPPDLDEKYRKSKRPKRFYEESPFCFDDFCISHKGQSGYICKKNGEKLWAFNGKAYLYTDINKWNDRVFFGTAGNGGYFYVLDIEDGTKVSDIKTGGTTSIAQKGNLCFVLSNEKSAVLLCVDLNDGAIKQKINLAGKANMYSKIQLMDDKLHAITFEYSRGVLQNAVWTCVSL